MSRAMGAAACLLSLLISACGASTPSGANAVEGWSFQGQQVTADLMLPDVTLSDTQGRPYNLKRSPSRPVTLLLLASTRCGSHCDALMAAVTQALFQLSPSARDRVGFLYVTTDPARDDARALRAYLNRYGLGYIGLRTDQAATLSLADQVGVHVVDDPANVDGISQLMQSLHVTAFVRDTPAQVLWTDEMPVTAIADDLAVLTEQR